jgi:chemosensory pili system protein ChpC
LETSPEAVRCLVLPVHDDQVLVPSAVVAEVFAARDIPALEGAPRWLIGRVVWRDASLPVVSIEAAVGGERPPVGERAKIVVLRSLGAEEPLAFYALLIQGIPRQVLASSRTVQSRPRDRDRPFVAQDLDLEGERAFIPDLDALERALVAFADSWRQSPSGENVNASDFRPISP